MLFVYLWSGSVRVDTALDDLPVRSFFFFVSFQCGVLYWLNNWYSGQTLTRCTKEDMT